MTRAKGSMASLCSGQPPRLQGTTYDVRISPHDEGSSPEACHTRRGLFVILKGGELRHRPGRGTLYLDVS